MEYFLGIDLGGTNIALGVVNKDGKIVQKHSIPTKSQRPFDQVLKDMVNAAFETLKMAGVDKEKIPFVGIGVPSTIEPKTQQVVFANNLGWKNRDVIGEFQKHWNIPVFMGNDADCAALGESMVKPASDYDNLLMITIGTGLGGGVITNKKVFSGGDGTGFEPGHIIINHNGIRCTCGTKGCLEAYASVTALIRQTIDMMISCPESLMWGQCEGDFNKVDGFTAIEAAKRKDSAAIEVVDQFLEYISSGLASLISLFRPQVIIVGGGISKQGDYLLDPLREKTKAKTYASDIMDVPPILQAKLGNDAGIIGAALLNARD